MSTKPGATDAPGGVDDLRRVALDVLADRDDHAALDRDVADEGGATGAVDDGAPDDLQLEHVASVPRRRSGEMRTRRPHLRPPQIWRRGR